MSRSSESYFLEVISGRRRGPAAAALRGFLAIGEVGFAAATGSRNFLYDRRLLPIHHLGRPTISIGNLTTGGTGKTPLVCWLAAAMRSADRKPAVLMRGYKSKSGMSDEQTLIAQANPNMPVIANPNRIAGAAAALAEHPEIDLFILDDAMQHRRARRDLEIVLVSALEPWSNSHLLPRGLLRESLAGLRRADVIVITHANHATAAIESLIRRYHPTCPIVLAEHSLANLIDENESEQPMARLTNCKYYVACAIGQPMSFVDSLRSYGTIPAGQHFFPDHHSFGEQDITAIRQNAAIADASMIIVTEKDWTKLQNLPNIRETGVPFWRARMNLLFPDDGERKLLDLVLSRIKQ